MALNQIPYTNVHELNLDWVLAEIKKFDEYITSIKHIIDELASYYETVDHLQEEVEALHNEVNSYSGRIEALESAVNNLQREITELESDLLRAIRDEANTRKAADDDLQNQINAIKHAIDNIDSLYAYINSVYKSLRAYIDSSILGSERRLYLYINGQVKLLQDQIDDIYEKLRHVAVDVYNQNAYEYSPDGRIDFDLNNRLIYQHCANTLTAEEYMSLGLTVNEYATHTLTVTQYLEQGRKWLKYDHVFMPDAGVRQSIENACSDALTAAIGTLTVDEFAALDLDADNYAALNLTAHQYLFLDSNGALNDHVYRNDLSTGITVDQYSELMIKEG